jgi:hypothetical protein
MAEVHAVEPQASRASTMVEALALGACYFLFDRFVAGLTHSATYNVSNTMPGWLAALFVSRPQGIAAALLGWFVSRIRPSGAVAVAATGSLLFAARIALHWQETVAATSHGVVMELLFESLIVPLAFVAACIVTALYFLRVPLPAISRSPWQAPGLRLLLVLIALTLTAIFIVQPLQWIALLYLGWAPVAVAPVLMSLVPLIVYFALARLLVGMRWLPWEGCLVVVVYAVSLHLVRWVLGATYANHWLALLLMWCPVAAVGVGFAAGFGTAIRSRVARHLHSITCSFEDR